MPIPDGTKVNARIATYPGGPILRRATVCGQNATHYDVMTEDGEHYAVPWHELEAENPDAVRGPP